jgi:hypothetical protein
VPPLEAEQWADEIMALWDDEDRRAELGRMGVARAQQFSWNRAARETLKVYRRAVERIVPRAEPLPPMRHAPPEPLPAISLAALGPDAPRPCLRCGTALLPGELQLGVSMAPRIWSCPRCGYVELVNETHQAAHQEHTEHAAIDVDQPAQSSSLPVVPEAGSVADADVADVASAAPTDVEPSEELAALDDAPVASAAPADVEPSEELAALDDAPMVSAAPTDVEPSEELAALEAGAVASADGSELEQAALPDAAMPDTPIQDFSANNDSDPIAAAPDAPGTPDGSAPAVAAGTALAPHPPQSSNGTAPKPRSNRGSRRQQPAAEPAVKPPAKRRSSGSKRKQTM